MIDDISWSSRRSDTAKDFNKCRIELLQRQSDLLDSTVADVRRALGDITADAGAYGELMVGLISQGLDKLQQDDLLIR